jgi:hypothetical protein
MIGGSSPGRGWEFLSSPPRSDRLWGPHSLLSDGTRGCFAGVKRPGHEDDDSPPSSAEVKECVELYLHSPNTQHVFVAWCLVKHRDNFTRKTPVISV